MSQSSGNSLESGGEQCRTPGSVGSAPHKDGFKTCNRVFFARQVFQHDGVEHWV